MKKLLSVLLVFVLVMSTMLAGCGQAEKAPEAAAQPEAAEKTEAKAEEKAEEKPEKLVVIVSNELEPLMNAAADIFYDKFGIDVEVIAVAYDSMHDKTVTMVKGDSQLDLVNVDGIWAAEYARAGISIGLNDYMPQEILDTLFDSFVNSMYVDGQLHVVPFQTDAKWLYYNKAMLAEAGYDAPPTTWTELMDMSKTMIDKGITKYGVAWAGNQAEGLVCEFTSLMAAHGGTWRNAEGKWEFNNEAGAAALNLMIDSMKNGVADPASVTFNDRTVLDPFMAGDMAFVPCWSYAYNLIRDPAESKVAADVGIALLPGSEGITSGSVTGGGGMAITTTCKYPEYAAELLKITVDMQIQEKSLETLGNMPILKSVLEDPDRMKENPHFAVMAEEYQYAAYRPTVTNYSEWSVEMQGYLSKALIGEITVDEALSQMQAISLEKYN